MKVPFSWLKDYVDIDCSPEELKDKLFSCGFEVEEMLYVAKHIDKIVSCKVLSIEQHPNADKLSVTQVDAGKYGKLQIITSAKNIKVGDIVPVAVDGATLNNGEHIYNGELRGLPSYGMFCSGEELGIDNDWYEGASVNGILILKDDFPLGEEVKKLLNIEDVIFDINVTANRPDCQSIVGIAREVAAVLNKKFKMPDLSYVTDKNLSTLNTVKVTDSAFDLCPRYKAHLVKDVKIEESPLWLKRKLFSMGLRSINNIVDITNFVLLEIGQPMHAFDLSEISGSEINIRRAKPREKIITLDEKEFELNENNLVICDIDKPVALAGVMGGLNSEIKATTKDVLFESAKFARDNIRKTSRALGQRSDSSARFEKGVDYLSVEVGLSRALHLITELKCGTIACDEYDLIDSPIKEKVIDTKISKINSVLGIDISSEYIYDILERLNFGITVKGDDISVTVPLYREDMESYPDIAEEIIREYGYDHIEPTLLKSCAITNGGLTDDQKNIENLKNLLIGYGFNEMLSYSFVSEKDYDLFGIDKLCDSNKFIKLINPISEDMAIMRTTLLPSVIRAVCYNLNRKNNEGRLFEIAKVYHPKSIPVIDFPTEDTTLSFALFGDKEDFFTLKGVVEGITDTFCFGQKVEFFRSTVKSLHPTRSADIIINGINVGYMGQISPVICGKLGADKPIYACEINIELLKKFYNDKIVFRGISKFPIVERDLAITVDENVAWAEVIKTVEKSAGEFLTKVALFDIYRGEQIGEGKKSMAFNLVYVSNERTLNVDEIEESIKNILKALKENLSAELR